MHTENRQCMFQERFHVKFYYDVTECEEERKNFTTYEL